MSKNSRVLSSVLAATTFSAVIIASHRKAGKYGVKLHEQYITPDNVYNYSAKILDLVTDKIFSKKKENESTETVTVDIKE